MCIPESSLREKIIKELHSERHFGRDKTLALMSKNFYWPKLKRDVQRFMESLARYLVGLLLMLVFIFPYLFLQFRGEKLA